MKMLLILNIFRIITNCTYHKNYVLYSVNLNFHDSSLSLFVCFVALRPKSTAMVIACLRFETYPKDRFCSDPAHIIIMNPVHHNQMIRQGS